MAAQKIRVKIRDQRGRKDSLPEALQIPKDTKLGDFLETLPLTGGPGYYTVLQNGRMGKRMDILREGDEISILPLSVGG